MGFCKFGRNLGCNATRSIRYPQNLLATFIGAFLFSLVGITALRSDVYDESSPFILFLATLTVITVVVITMLRWIQPSSKFGRLEETTHRIEQAAMHVIQKRIEHPYLGEKLLEDTEKIPDNIQLLYKDKTGYIEHIDIAALSRCMEAIEGESGLMSAPREFVYPAFAKTLYESGPSLMQATLEFVRMRLQPISMMALTFILGVTPLMIATGVGSGAQNAIGTGVYR